MRSRSALIVAGIAVWVTMGSATHHATAEATGEAQESTTWSIAPAAEAGPDARVSFRHELDPGETLIDHVAVTNFSASAATFDVYASDGIVTAGGDFDLLTRDETPSGGGSWITVEPGGAATERVGGGQTVVVPAGESVVLPVRITVPVGATPGDHPAGIVAELVDASDSMVRFITRVGARVHLRVTGDLVPRLAIASVEASYNPSWNPFGRGTLVVDYTVVNDGNVRLGTDVRMQAAGPWGVGSVEDSASWREMLPAQTASLRSETPAWPAFFFWVEVQLDPVVVGEDDIDMPLSSVTSGLSTWAFPWSQIGLLLVLGAVAALIVRARRRGARLFQARVDAAVAAALTQDVADRDYQPRRTHDDAQHPHETTER